MEVTPHTPITTIPEPSLESTQEPKIKQEPVPEGPITEIPQDDPAPRRARKSREESNLETGLNGIHWQCNEDHGRRTRFRNKFTEEVDTPGHCNNCKDWDSENWDNVYYFKDEAQEETKDERD